MRRFPAYLVAFLALVSAFASCGRRERVIPREEMAEIYAEMYVLDQWLDENGSFRREADTSLVYAPVFGKYGYTTDDYLRSVSAYMKDPTRYSRILRRTSEILNARLAELKAEKKAREEALEESRRLDSLRNLVRLNMDSLMQTMSRTNPSDSLVAGLDSLGFLDFRFVQTSDTTFDGPAMVIRIDSLSVAADSVVVVADSTAVVRDISVVVRDNADVADSPAAVPETGTVTRLKPGTEPKPAAGSKRKTEDELPRAGAVMKRGALSDTLMTKSLPEPLTEAERQVR